MSLWGSVVAGDLGCATEQDDLTPMYMAAEKYHVRCMKALAPHGVDMIKAVGVRCGVADLDANA